jgi:hypothetical protein
MTNPINLTVDSVITRFESSRADGADPSAFRVVDSGKRIKETFDVSQVQVIHKITGRLSKIIIGSDTVQHPKVIYVEGTVDELFDMIQDAIAKAK